MIQQSVIILRHAGIVSVAEFHTEIQECRERGPDRLFQGRKIRFGCIDIISGKGVQRIEVISAQQGELPGIRLIFFAQGGDFVTLLQQTAEFRRLHRREGIVIVGEVLLQDLQSFPDAAIVGIKAAERMQMH